MLERINSIVWGIPALIMILATGVYFTAGTGFIQIRWLVKALRLFLSKLTQSTDDSGISPFQALCTALAATVGTGNLAGVAGAITLGGPGAVFWMWVSGILGMVIKMAEATLAVYFRIPDQDGGYAGGPMYIICKGMGKRWKMLACGYCFFGVVASLGVGNGTQINTVVASVQDLSQWLGLQMGPVFRLSLGVILAITTFLLLLGGARRIGRIAERLVPVASVCYLLLCLWVLTAKYTAIPAAVLSIVRGAFSPRAVTGGMIGSLFIALRTGISRGVFTNEAGMGTAGIAHASAKVDHPVEQGLLGCVEVFLDTILICTMTALVILCSGVQIPYGTDSGISLTTQAFSSVLGEWVNIPISAFLCCFAFATILGWGVYGSRCAQFLFGRKVLLPFAAIHGSMAILSAVMKTGTVWVLSEIVNGMMALPNLLVLTIMSPVFFSLIKEYRGHLPSVKGMENV